jgi:hypothetical protein
MFYLITRYNKKLVSEQTNANVGVFFVGSVKRKHK